MVELDVRLADGSDATINVTPGGNATAQGAVSFLFQPGGTAGANVFTTWVALYAAVNALDGIRTVQVDDSIAPATVPAGAYDLSGWVLAGTFQASTLTSFTPVLTFETGATITDLPDLVTLSLTLESASTSPVYAFDTAPSDLVLDLGAQVQSGAGAAPFLSSPAGSTGLAFLGDNCRIGDGTNAAWSVVAGATAYLLQLPFSVLNTNALTGTGTVSAQVALGATCNTTQPALTGALNRVTIRAYEVDGSAGSPAYSFLSTPTSGMYRDPTTGNVGASPGLLYVPATPFNWVAPPTAVGPALDLLVAPNVIANKNATEIAPAASITYTSSQAITRTRGGVVQVNANATVTAAPVSGSATLTMTLLRDGVAVATAPLPQATTTGQAQLVLSWFDTLPDATAHTYGFTVASSSGTVTVAAANQAGISAAEL